MKIRFSKIFKGGNGYDLISKMIEEYVRMASYNDIS